MKKLSIFLLALWGLSANAYHLGDHSAVTHEAFQELVRCFPKAQTLLNVEWITSADLNEDIDLVTKWLFYSHYYNPDKELEMRRADSSERVGGLASILKHPSAEGIDIMEMSTLGHMIHHLQDATVPSHVVPVDHSMWDGFETYDVNGFNSGLTCGQIAALPIEDPLVTLKETALQTLNNIHGFRFDFVTNTAGITNRLMAVGTAFWQESKDNSFGQYGYLGNNFGETSFEINGVDYQIAATNYQNFKKQQLRLAVQATLRGLMWELGDQLKNIETACAPGVTAQND